MKKRVFAGLLSVLLVFSMVMPAVLAENLKYGVSGAEVTQAQSRLKELGYYTDKVDGKFGYSTYLAVKAFQQKNSLKVDGVIGPVTYLALYRADALTAGGKAGGTAAYQRVSYGSEGPAVVTVQNQLRKLGYYKGIVDGKFGYATYMAVRAFQAANGLAVDGIVGPLTWDALTSGLPVPTIPKPAPAPLRVQLNDKGAIVSQIQQKLVDLKYNPGKVDGVFGYATYLAVRAFQGNNKLKVDGIVGPLTWAKLFGASPVPAGAAPAAPMVTPVPDGVTPKVIRVQYNQQNALVTQVQQRLIELKYMDPGSADGFFGFRTYQAVRAFQRLNRLQVDGIVGPETWAKLFSATAIANK